MAYAVFAYKLDKAVAITRRRRGEDLALKTKDGMVRIALSDIYYVEVMRHRLVYHTARGPVETWGALSQAEKALKDRGFSRCSSCYLVNLRYVDRVEENQAVLPHCRLEVSRGKKQQFLRDLSDYLGV